MTATGGESWTQIPSRLEMPIKIHRAHKEQRLELSNVEGYFRVLCFVSLEKEAEHVQSSYQCSPPERRLDFSYIDQAERTFCISVFLKPIQLQTIFSTRKCFPQTRCTCLYSSFSSTACYQVIRTLRTPNCPNAPIETTTKYVAQPHRQMHETMPWRTLTRAECGIWQMLNPSSKCQREWPQPVYRLWGHWSKPLGKAAW